LHTNTSINREFIYQNINHLPKWVLSGGLKINADQMSYVTFYGDYSKQGPYQEAIAGGLYSRKAGDEDIPTFTLHMGMFTVIRTL
jgi:hypothetical protein